MIVTLRLDGEEMRVEIKPAEPDHIPFVMNSWLESYRVGDDPRKMGNGLYYKHQHRVCTALVQRAPSFVAVPVDEPTVFIGWACAEPDRRILHYSFVKKSFRAAGLFGHLIGAFWPDETDSEITLTHHTHFISDMRKRSPRWERRLVYNPYLRSAA